jgi:hypothetical protein
MGGGLLAVCGPVLLKRAYDDDDDDDDHALNKPGTLEVAVAGRKLRIGGNAGLTQVMPDDGIGNLTAPATVTLRGKASDEPGPGQGRTPPY